MSSDAVEAAREEWLRLIRNAVTEEDWARAHVALEKLIKEEEKRMSELLACIRAGAFPSES